MVIVLIHWKINPEQGMVDEFLKFWRETATIDDRQGLIGEFLTEPHSKGEYRWITWPLTGCEGNYRSFINVGYWTSVEEFYAQVGRHFETSSGPKPFEAAPRVRTVMTPRCWRIGSGALPPHDSSGVQ